MMSLNWKLRLHMDISGPSRHKANRQKKRDMGLAVASGHRDVELLLYKEVGGRDADETRCFTRLPS